MVYKNSEMRALIDEYVHSERDRRIMCSRLIDGLTFEQIAEREDMSDKQIKRIVYRLQAVLFEHL